MRRLSVTRRPVTPALERGRLQSGDALAVESCARGARAVREALLPALARTGPGVPRVQTAARANPGRRTGRRWPARRLRRERIWHPQRSRLDPGSRVVRECPPPALRRG